MPLSVAASPSQLAMSPDTLSTLRRDARRLEPGAVHQVARQFEALFLREVLSNVRAGALAKDVLGSDQLETYQEMFDAQLADSLASGGGIGSRGCWKSSCPARQRLQLPRSLKRPLPQSFIRQRPRSRPQR